jgi:adenine/guanine phosphoribosyltransferase-like PRPP-binding protein
MPRPDTNHDPAALALSALAWILADQTRAERLLAVTGLTPTGLRARAGEPAMLAALLRFLEAHEPDLIACAEALGVAPAALVAAREELEA